MQESVHFLPLLCQQVQRRQVSRIYVQRWVNQTREAWLAECARSRSANPPSRPPTRAHWLEQERVQAWEREARQGIHRCLEHLARYAANGDLAEAARASAHWRRAEQARERSLVQQTRLAASDLGIRTTATRPA